MRWRSLKDDPPSTQEYAVLLFPCKSDVGILYTVSNPHFARKNGLKAGYTHWASFELAPTHYEWQRWQDNLR